ncbi:unnamed protein product [marine sediment metagenome]|uniref:Uncharacterized protein n=1 Tax=marine sediment metagenome TaxID=412755 RepID=X1FI50_9ZZZZ
MEGQLFENLQYVSGLSYFCNLLYHHLAKDSVIRERAPIILDNIKKQGIKEMICFHEKYNMDFEVIDLIEILDKLDIDINKKNF